MADNYIRYVYFTMIHVKSKSLRSVATLSNVYSIFKQIIKLCYYDSVLHALMDSCDCGCLFTRHLKACGLYYRSHWHREL